MTCTGLMGAMGGLGVEPAVLVTQSMTQKDQVAEQKRQYLGLRACMRLARGKGV